MGTSLTYTVNYAAKLRNAAVMDLSCANRVRVRKSHTPIALVYAIFSGGFRRIFQKSRTQNRVRKSRRVRKIESSWARFTYAILDLRTRFLLGFYWVWFAYTRSDLRTRFAYSTRFCVLDSNFRALLEYLCYFSNQTRCDLRTRFAYAIRFCVHDLRTRTRFFAPARIACAKEFTYAKRRTTSAPESSTQTFLYAMPAPRTSRNKWASFNQPNFLQMGT